MSIVTNESFGRSYCIVVLGLNGFGYAKCYLNSLGISSDAVFIAGRITKKTPL